MECLQAPLRTPSSPDRSRLIPFALDCTRLSPTGACSQARKIQEDETVLKVSGGAAAIVGTLFSVFSLKNCSYIVSKPAIRFSIWLEAV